MNFDILTIFPEIFPGPLACSITGRALEEKLITVNPVDIRDFSTDKHKNVDDYPYGGGAGMVMQPGPLYRAHQDVMQQRDYLPETILLSPQGKKFSQDQARELSQKPGVILICGHYEGVDERVRELIVDRELSLGDYVLTGGELPAMVVIDAVARMIPGVVGDEESTRRDSFYQGILDYPQYTRPRSFQELEVPGVLLSGHHARIERWRKKQALKRTWLRRPDLLEEADLDPEDIEILHEIQAELAEKEDNELVGEENNELAREKDNKLVGEENNELAEKEYNELAGYENNKLAGDKNKQADGDKGKDDQQAT